MVLNLSGIMAYNLDQQGILPNKYADLAGRPKVIGSCYDQDGNVIEDYLDFDYTGHSATVYIMKDPISIDSTFRWSFRVTSFKAASSNSGHNWLAMNSSYWMEYYNARLLVDPNGNTIVGGFGYDRLMSSEIVISSDASDTSIHFDCVHTLLDGSETKNVSGSISKSKIQSQKLRFGLKGVNPSVWNADFWRYSSTLRGSRLEVNGKLVFSRD